MPNHKNGSSPPSVEDRIRELKPGQFFDRKKGKELAPHYITAVAKKISIPVTIIELDGWWRVTREG